MLPAPNLRRVPKANKALRARKVLRASKAHRGRKALKASKGFRGRKVSASKDRPARPARKAPREKQVPQGHKDRMVRRAKQASKVP